MSALVNISGLSNATPVPQSAKLKGAWSFADLTGSTIADSLGGSNPLTAIAGNVPNIAAGELHKGRWDNALAYLGVADTDVAELVAPTRNTLISLWISFPTHGTSSGVMVSKQINGRSVGVALEIAGSGGASTIVRWNYNNSVQNSNTMSNATIHHIAGVLDPNNSVWDLYVDGAKDTASATGFPSMSPASSDSLMVGGSGRVGSVNYGFQGFSATLGQYVDLWDVQVYTEDNASGLPANIDDLVAWLSKHPYQYLNQDQW